MTSVRRLERRDEAKNIDYDAEFSSRSSSLVIGREEEEMDRIFKSLGVSGPEDLSISFDSWEACKSRAFELDKHKVRSEACHGGVTVDLMDPDTTELKKTDSIDASTSVRKSWARMARGSSLSSKTDLVDRIKQVRSHISFHCFAIP